MADARCSLRYELYKMVHELGRHLLGNAFGANFKSSKYFWDTLYEALQKYSITIQVEYEYAWVIYVLETTRGALINVY